MEETHSTPKKATRARTSFAATSPSRKEKMKPTTSKAISSHLSCSVVASDMKTFNLTSNAALRASLRPKRRSHRVPTCAKTFPLIKKSLTISLRSHQSLQVSDTSQVKELPTN